MHELQAINNKCKSIAVVLSIKYFDDCFLFRVCEETHHKTMKLEMKHSELLDYFKEKEKEYWEKRGVQEETSSGFKLQ